MLAHTALLGEGGLRAEGVCLVEAAVDGECSVTTDNGPKAPAHARSGFRHWALVAAGCAAVVGGALAANPAQGSITAITQPSAQPSPSAVKQIPASAAPDPGKAELPLDCGPFPVKVTLSLAVDLGDGRPSTVVAAHCAAETGTPPDGAYLLVNGPAGTPVIAATLVDPKEQLTVTDLTVRSDGTIHAKAKGYSSDDVPRCCPDVNHELTWARHGSQWVRTDTATPATVI
jgi:hypothetical protein